MEQVDVKLAGNNPSLRSNPFDAKWVQVVSMAPNHVFAWHVGPRRQLVATISGGGEIETGDGQKLSIKPGVVTRIEDLTGEGHVTRIGPDGHLCLFIRLQDDAVIG